MKNFLLISLLMLAFVSCEKSNEDDSTMPEIPQNDSIDIDNDAVFDFVVEYYSLETTDVPSSGQSIIGEIKPLDNNQLLYSQTKGDLFLIENDTIKQNNNSNAVWSNYPASLIRINTVNSIWEREWAIYSNSSSGYFLGFKLNNAPEKIGWMQLNFDTISGKITIVDNDITDLEELIIEKNVIN